MAREKLQTLTEPMYYILLALLTEQCGVDIMGRVSEISRGRVTVGPGTLYAMLDRFTESRLIRKTAEEGRRKWYVITEEGRGLLEREQERLRTQWEDGAALLK